jgi:hypothetical protein
MAPTSATKWFKHIKTLECDEALRRYNSPSVRNHMIEWTLKPKTVAYIIREASHHVACISI